MPPLNASFINYNKSDPKNINEQQLVKMNGTTDKSSANGVNYTKKLNLNSSDTQTYRLQIVWFSVFKISLLHVIGFYGVFYCLLSASIETIIFGYLVAICGSFGILSGAHRLWSHRCYKAHILLRVLLMILQTLALQNNIYEWCRDHRVHHKYSETDADPHNSKRGFFFAHMGWLMAKKHPLVIQKGRLLDMSDLLADPVVRFQRKYYTPLVIIIWGIIPTVIPWYFWSEPLLAAFAINMSRYIVSLHQTWLVNSAAHMFGYRTYDKDIQSRENKSVVYMSLGEGYHNYHHTFPYDYSASEYGWKTNFNLATAFIDFFATLGLAYDLRVASDKAVADRKHRTGDHLKRVQTNTYLDYIFGLFVVTWPVWLAFSVRYIHTSIGFYNIFLKLTL